VTYDFRDVLHDPWKLRSVDEREEPGRVGLRVSVSQESSGGSGDPKHTADGV